MRRLLEASRAAGQTSVHAAVRESRGRFELELSVQAAGGTQAKRSLEAFDCTDLAEAAALLVALAVDPDFEAPIVAEPAAEPVDEQALPVEADSSRPFSLQLAGLLDTAGLSPSPSFGPRITPRWHIRHFSLGLQVAGLFETAQESVRYPEADVASGVVLAAPEACFGADLGAWTLSPCAQLEAGATWLRTSGVESPSRAWDLWLAAGAEARAQWWIYPRWALELGVGLSVPLRRSTFAIESKGGPVALHRAAAAGLRVSVGVTYAARP